jgi:hypothetical protein
MVGLVLYSGSYNPKHQYVLLTKQEANGHFETAANKFLTGMRNAITTFNTSYDVDRAYALARGGVVALDVADKYINDQERDTTKPGYTGTKCPL